jgi:hypothetical protein
MLHVDNGLLLIASPPITRRYSYAESASTIARQHVVPWRDLGGRKVCETTTNLIAAWGADNRAISGLRYDTVSFERADGSMTGIYELLPLASGYDEYGLFYDGTNVARSIYCGGNTKLGLYVTSVQFDGSVYTSASCRIYYLKSYGTGELGSYGIGSAVKLKSFVESAPSDKHYTVTETIS